MTLLDIKKEIDNFLEKNPHLNQNVVKFHTSCGGSEVLQLDLHICESEIGEQVYFEVGLGSRIRI